MLSCILQWRYVAMFFGTFEVMTVTILSVVMTQQCSTRESTPVLASSTGSGTD